VPFHPDFLDDYPDVTEDVGTDFPAAFGRKLDTALFLTLTTLMITLHDALFPV
jgi:hypothetical protein